MAKALDTDRFVVIEDGIASVVTYLHGSWDAYAGLRDRFLSMHARGRA